MLQLDELADLVGGILAGDPTTEISDAASVGRAGPGDITFVTSERYLQDFISSDASAAIIARELQTDVKPTIAVEHVESAFIKVVEQFRPRHQQNKLGISPQAIVSPSALIADDVDIFPGAVIGDDVQIGCGSVIMPNVTILDRCRIGSNVRVFPSCVLYPDTVVGDRCILHGGVVLGAYGFGYKTRNGMHKLTAQLGNVVLGNDVEVGANSTIDRGTFESTIIGDGTKLDDQVMIGHNCRIGKNNLLCSQVGIAGSCNTGDNVVMAGQVGIGDHINIGSNVTLIAKTGVMKDIEDGQIMSGAPATPVRRFFQIAAVHAKLPEMRKQLKQLAQQIEKLESETQSAPSRDAA
jgi:UDP-3-O-[3-hydroxymyristoyl] glucosamine N-acyltransferase